MKDDRIVRSLDVQGNPVSEGLLRQQRIGRRKRHAAENICAKDAFINNSPGATRMSSRRGDIGSVQSAHRNSGETGSPTFENYAATERGLSTNISVADLVELAGN